MDFAIFNRLKLALTVVKDLFNDVDSIKYKMYMELLHLSPQIQSKGKNNKCLFSKLSNLLSERKDLKHQQ